MLPADRLQLAIDIHARSYRLLRWLAEAVGKGFIPATRAHEYADAADSARDWLDEHYLNLPTETRHQPDAPARNCDDQIHLACATGWYALEPAKRDPADSRRHRTASAAGLP